MNQDVQHNREAWNDRARNRGRHTRTVTERELREPLRAVDPEGWLAGGIRGWKVLCLAAGGGLQGALYAAAGAEVTVVDLSPEMLELDRRVGEQTGYRVRTLAASMENLEGLQTGSFDLVIQPVSTCYVPRVEPVFQEVARVLRAGGLYISQHKQPISLQAAHLPAQGRYVLEHPYHWDKPLPDAPDGLMHREHGTREFLHTWEALVGGICRAGFVVEDFSEPRLEDPEAKLGEAPHRYVYAPPYFKIRARRREAEAVATGRLWLPGR